MIFLSSGADFVPNNFIPYFSNPPLWLIYLGKRSLCWYVVAFKVSIDLPRASIVSFPRSMAPDLFVLNILLQLAFSLKHLASMADLHL